MSQESRQEYKEFKNSIPASSSPEKHEGVSFKISENEWKLYFC